MAHRDNRYDAFISYSQRVDGKLAPAFQEGLHRLAKPWYRMRALRVFRDDANLSANPNLWASIEEALEASEWFVLLASSEAASSEWVAREVGFWRTAKSTERMLVVLTAGELRWDPVAGDFDWSRTTAIPHALAGSFSGEPRFIDVRWARTVDDVSLRNARFRDSVADVAATIHGVPKDEILGEDVRQHRRTVRLARGGILLLALLLVAAVSAALIALSQRDQARAQRTRAEEQSRIATARQLAAQAVNTTPTDYSLGLLLAAQAHELRPGAPTRSALIEVLSSNPHFVGAVPLDEAVTASAVSPVGRRLALGGTDGSITVWDLRKFTVLSRASAHGSAAAAVAWHPDGSSLVSVGADGSAFLWPRADDLRRSPVQLAEASGAADTDERRPGAAIGFDAGGDRFTIVHRGVGDTPTAVEYDSSGQRLGAFDLRHISEVPVGVHYGRDDLLEVQTAGAMVYTLRGSGPAAPAEDGEALLDGVPYRGLGDPFQRVFTAFSPDGRWYAEMAGVVDASSPRVLDAQTEETVFDPLAGPEVVVEAGTFDPAGSALYTASDGAITAWDLDTGRADSTVVVGYPGLAETVLASADGLVIAISSGAATVWDLAHHNLVTEVDPGNTAPIEDVPDAVQYRTDVAFDPTGRLVAWPVVTFDTAEVVVYDLDLGEVVDRFDDVVAHSLAFTADGSRIVTNYLGDAHEIVVETGKVTPRADPGDDASDPPSEDTDRPPWYADDGDNTGASIDVAGVVALWDIGRAVPTTSIMVPGADIASGLAFSPGGDRLAVATPGGELDLIDLDPDHLGKLACRLARRSFTDEELSRFLPDEPGITLACRG